MPSTFLISLYIIGYTLTRLGILPKIPFLDFSLAGTIIDIQLGLIGTVAPSITTLIFSVPFIICLIIIDRNNYFSNKSFLVITILLSFIAILTTFRRAIILNLLLTPLVIIFFISLSRWNDKIKILLNFRKTMFIGIFFIIGTMFFVNSTGIVNVKNTIIRITSAFNSNKDLQDKGTKLRYNQIELLIKSWEQKPLFGHGHGSVSEYMIRNENTPWLYELSYFALLFQTGIIGLIVYLGLLFWPIIKGIQLLKKGNTECNIYIMPCLVGYVFILIGNASNPYLASYDYSWSLFFPVTVINFFILNDKETS